MTDIEDLQLPDGPIKPRGFAYKDQEYENLEHMVRAFLADPNITEKKHIGSFKLQMCRTYAMRGTPRIMDLRYVYFKMLQENKIEPSDRFEELMTTKDVRVDSGVAVYTTQTDPFQNSGLSFHKLLEQINSGEEIDLNLFDEHGNIKGAFTCKYDCRYCPNFPLVEFERNGKKYKIYFPRSYMPGEPSPERAMRNNFDTVRQIHERGQAYLVNGHSNDKAEWIIEGGTWDSHDIEYRWQLIRQGFYAFNTMYQNRGRPMMTLEEEMKLNERTDVKVCHLIGITIETRPDQITPKAIQIYRAMGVTRVQLGIQSTNDRILNKVKRGCHTKDAKRAIMLLLNAGFKIDIHIMFGLPGASFEDDIASLNDFLNDPELRHDQVKLYPTIVIDHTKIKEWQEDGSYRPYFEDDFELLLKAISHYQSQCPFWVRINRTQRDVPTHYYTYEGKQKTQLIYGGSNKSDLRNLVDQYMADNGMKSRDIRSREVRNKKVDPTQAKLFVEQYVASGGTEYFISFELPDRSALFGFTRLRLAPNAGKEVEIQELEGCAMIRELHVYGRMTEVGTKRVICLGGRKVQHMGFGRKLLAEAEKIARVNGYKKISVISGVGVRGYYRKNGFVDGDLYLIKTLSKKDLQFIKKMSVTRWILIIVVLIMIMYLSFF